MCSMCGSYADEYLSVLPCCNIASTGVAQSLHGMNCEDTITLSVQWENISLASDDAGVSSVVVTGLGK